MVDPIPAGTTYNNDVTCSSGTCGFDGSNVTWAGSVPIAGDVTVNFSVATVGMGCGTNVTNLVTVDDPDLYGGPVTKSVGTTLIAGTPAPLDGFEVSVPPPGWTETIVYDPGTDPDWSQVMLAHPQQSTPMVALIWPNSTLTAPAVGVWPDCGQVHWT